MEVLEYMKLENLNALLLFPGANMAYYTGLSIGLSERLAAAVIPLIGDPYFVVNELEEELRGQEPWFNETVIWKEEENPIHVLGETLSDIGLDHGRFGIPEEAPWGWINSLEKHLPEAVLVDVSKYLGYVRMIKTEREIELIEQACKITDEAMEEGLDQLHTGITEKELQKHMVTCMQERGGGNTFAGVLFSERAALPHGGSSERELQPGEFILVDMGCTVEGYWSDCTRTVMYGEASNRQKEIYDTVLAANRAALNRIIPGNTCESVDMAARRVIEEAGYGEYFIHRLGHGIGLEVHEHPYIVRNNKQELEQGMVFSDEPGIYIVDEIGVRVEDTVICTSEGGRCLTDFPRELQEYTEK
jgi:Xaa-Pro dipeptidase